MNQTRQMVEGNVAGLRTVATLEFAKGMLVLLIGIGLASLLRRGMDIEDASQSLMFALHLNPERHLAQLFLDATAHLNDVNLMLVAGAAAVYALMRFVEAYGLWNGRVWAQWFALASGMVYLPLEIYELIRKPAAGKWTLLAVNLVIVLYIAYLRLRSRAVLRNSAISDQHCKGGNLSRDQEFAPENRE